MNGEFIIAEHTCICGRGTIEVTKKKIFGIGPNQLLSKYPIVSISSCSECGSTMDNTGYEYDEKKKTKIII